MNRVALGVSICLTVQDVRVMARGALSGEFIRNGVMVRSNIPMISINEFCGGQGLALRLHNHKTSDEGSAGNPEDTGSGAGRRFIRIT